MVNFTKKMILQVGNIIGFVATVIINALANILPFNNITTGQISDTYPGLFVPAGFTFSIWSVIYILLGLFSIYQAKDIFKDEKEDLKFLDQIDYFFIISSIANILWIFFWHYTNLIVTIFLMLIILFSLLLIYTRLEVGVAKVERNVKIFVHLPFSVYLGWITVATIANVSALLVGFGVSSAGPLAEFLTIFVIIVAVLITSLMLWKRKDIAYSLVIIWAFFGIFSARIGTTLPNLLIAVVVLISIFVILAEAIFTGYKWYSERE